MKAKYVLFAGILLLLSFIVVYATMLFTVKEESVQIKAIKQEIVANVTKPQVIGFLPYWLLSKADKDYTEYITTLTYFSLTIESDGKIQQYVHPGEKEPGLYALESGKADTFLNQAKGKNIKRSLLVFSGTPKDIELLLEHPREHAKNLVTDVAPFMKAHEFTDLNVDIEHVGDVSENTRNNFTVFIQEIKNLLNEQKLGTLTIDASPTDLVRKRLINLKEVANIADYTVLMTYDYHYAGSAVSGPVAPIGGAGIDAEFDVETGIQKALEVIPPQKIILGVPLYGYEWETLTETPRSATIPTSGLVISNRRIEDLLATCASCSAQLDVQGKESYLVYKDQETGTFHHVFYPDKKATEEKTLLANTYGLHGIALWALGYEGNSMLGPLKIYKR